MSDYAKIIEDLKNFLSKNQNPYFYKSHSFPYEKDLVFNSEPWATGGRCGGSCWNDGANENVTPEPEQEIELLYKFLEENYPELSFINFRKLEKFIRTYEYCNSEYYGNYTEYSMNYICFEDIANAILDNQISKQKSKNIND